MLILFLIQICFLNNTHQFIANKTSSHTFTIGSKKSVINVKTRDKQINFNQDQKITIPLISDSLRVSKMNSRKRQEMPILYDHLSNKLIKLMYEKDLQTFTEKKEQEENKLQWRIRPHPKRLVPIFYRLGDEVIGRVSKIYPTYALVDVGSTCYGILHARDISDNWTVHVKHALKLGMDYSVVITGIDERGRSLRLTMRKSQIERVNKLVGNFKNLTLEESVINTNLNGDSTTDSEFSPITANKIKVKLHVPPSVSPFPYPYKIHKLENRKQPHEYQLNELVFGRVTRYTGMGCFVDIGATVDAFLHYKDSMLFLPERKKRLDLKVGNYLDKLYIKNINAARNRIGVTFKTIEEDLEERIVSGKDTIEDQIGYDNSPLHNECLENFANYVDFLKLSGLFDGFLKEIGGTRDCSLKYLAYLTNLHNQKLLKEEQMSLYVERFTPKTTEQGEPDPKFAYRKINIKTKKGRNEFKNRFNSLSGEISKWDSALIRPEKKSVYDVGEASVWNNDVSTPLNDKTSKYYFRNLNSQIKHALDVVQGNSLDKVDICHLSNHSLLANFKILKETFETKLSNSSNVDDVTNRDNMSLTEDIISLRKKHQQLSETEDETINPVDRVLNEIITIKNDSDQLNSESKSCAREPISLDYADSQTRAYEEFRTKSKSKKKRVDAEDLDIKNIIDLSNELDNLKPKQVLELIKSMEDACSEDPELSVGLEKLKILTKDVMKGNLTEPLQFESEGCDNPDFLDEESQELLQNAIAFNAKKKQNSKIDLDTAKQTFISPDPTKYIPKGSEIEGCWYILQDLLKITRFNRMLDRFGISTDQPPEKLIRDIANIAPKLVLKRIDTDKKLDFNFTEDHHEEIPHIPP